jgi:hypothetical protein
METIKKPRGRKPKPKNIPQESETCTESETIINNSNVSENPKETKVETKVSENIVETHVIENQVIENQVIENQVIENQVIENQVIENQVIETETKVVENLKETKVIENPVVDFVNSYNDSYNYYIILSSLVGVGLLYYYGIKKYFK